MDSVAIASQAEGLDTILPLLEEARHGEAYPLIEESLARQPDLPLWKYLKALVLCCQSRGPEAWTLLTELSRVDSFTTGFGLPEGVNTLLRASALNHLLFETTVEPKLQEPWETLDAVAELFGATDFIGRSITGRWKTELENSDYMDRFRFFYAGHPLEERIRLVEEVMEVDSEACLPRALLGAYMQEKGKTALAIRHLKKAHDENPAAWQPHAFLGKVFVAQGRFEDAEGRFREAIKLRGGASGELYAEIAECQKLSYRYDEAAETLFRSLEEFPQQFTQWDSLTEIATASGMQDRLELALANASQNQPSNSAIGSQVVRLALEAGDPLGAKDQLEAIGVLQNPGTDRELTELASRVLLDLGEPEQAASLLEAALAEASSHKELRTAYGGALIACDRPQEAEAVLRELAVNHPNERTIQIAWGSALLASGEVERANRAFSMASRLDPQDPEAATQQALALLALGQTNEAATLLKESAKKVDPPLPITLTGLGRVWELKGLRDISRDFFRQAALREPGNPQAVGGFLRQTHSVPADLKSTLREFLEAQNSDFAKAKLLLTLLHSALREGLAETARMIHQEFYGAVMTKIASPRYREFVDYNLTRRVPDIAAHLEKEGRFENAREVWRFAVTSQDPALTQRATSELVRLDTVEAAQLAQSGDSVSGSGAAAGDDPLLSLLSTTLPEEEDIASSTSAALFASPQQEAPLFADTPSVINPGEEASLFAQPIEQVVSQAESQEVPLFTQEPEPTPEPLPSMVSAASEPESEPLPPQSEPVTVEPVITPALQEEPLFAEPDSAPIEESPVGEPVVEQRSAEVVQQHPALVEVTTEPTLPEPLTSLAVEAESSSADMAEVAPATATERATEPDFTPQSQPDRFEPSLVEPLPQERKELLPIPMAVDFEPLTRRQLHFHEALTLNQSGVVAAETLAHLMVTSTLSHEPPDPFSAESGQQDGETMAQALAESATGLSEQQNYRAASKLLKTALIYCPHSREVAEAFEEVNGQWAYWLSQNHEYAHSVSLLREALRRNPHSASLEAQLESTYEDWMSWSDEKGDSAAHDLLAVYLQQEQSSLESFRQEWQASRERLRAQVASVTASPAPVAPQMPSATVAEAPAIPASAALPAMASPVPASPQTPPVFPEADAPAPPVSPEAGVRAPSQESAAQPTSVVAAAEAQPEASPVQPTAADVGVQLEPESQPSPPEAAPSAEQVKPTKLATTSESEATSETSLPDETAQATEGPPPAGGYTDDDAALGHLDGNPESNEIAEAVFAHFASNMRLLTTALRDRVTANPDRPIWLLLLARAFRRSSSETMAVIQYQKYIKANPTPEAYEELAQTYEQLGKEDFATMTRKKAERAFS